MTKRKVPVQNARGYADATTVAALLEDALLNLNEGQEHYLKKPLVFVALLPHDRDHVLEFNFPVGSELARVRTDKKADYQTFYLRTADKRRVIIFKKSGYHSLEPGDRIFFIEHHEAGVSRVMPRPTLETSLGMSVDMAGPTPRK